MNKIDLGQTVNTLANIGIILGELQFVVLTELHETYRGPQRDQLMDVGSFVPLGLDRQHL